MYLGSINDQVWDVIESDYAIIDPTNLTSQDKANKQYILKDKLTSFKMKDDESIPEMFHRLQVIVNDLKALGEKINDDDVSH